MIAIDLEVADQERLDRLAKSLGSDSERLARQIVVDYLDFQALPNDSEEAWAEAAITLAPEIMDVESWDGVNHESK